MRYHEISGELLAKYLNIMERSPACISPVFFFFSFLFFLSFYNWTKWQTKETTYQKVNTEYLFPQHISYWMSSLEIKRDQVARGQTLFLWNSTASRADYRRSLSNSKRSQYILFLIPQGSHAFYLPLLWYGFSGIFSKFLKLLVEIASSLYVISLRCSHGNWNRCVICNHLAVFKSPCVRMSQHHFAFSSAPFNKVEQRAEIFARV